MIIDLFLLLVLSTFAFCILKLVIKFKQIKNFHIFLDIFLSLWLTLFLIIIFALKCTLSDFYITISSFSLNICLIYLYPFTFNISGHLCIKYVFCKRHIIRLLSYLVNEFMYFDCTILSVYTY